MSAIDPIQAVIEIGSSRLRVLITQGDAQGEQGEFSVLGCGIASAEAVKSGDIKDIAATHRALRHAIEEAERQSGYEIRNVDVSMGGAQVMGLNSEAATSVNGEVSAAHISELVSHARQRVTEHSQRILHIFAQRYVLDERREVLYPRAMPAHHIKARFHVLRADAATAQTIERCMETVKVGVNAVVSSALASSYMATSAEEREVGVCALDIGAGTLDFVIWINGTVVASGGLNIGGEQVSSALATQYSTTRQYAEMLKCQQGAMSAALMKAPVVDIPHTGLHSGRKIASSEFADAISKSYEQLFQHFEAALRRLGILHEISIRSLVITGGAAQMPGLTNYLQERFKLPVRLAKPPLIAGLPDYLQYDAGMMGVLGIAKLLYAPLPDHVWEIKPKRDIIAAFTQFFRRGMS